MTDFSRQFRPNKPVVASTGTLETLSVTLPPGSSLAKRYSELNANYKKANADLIVAKATGNQKAIDKAQVLANLRKDQLNTFIKTQNAPGSTLDEKNIVDPNNPRTTPTVPPKKANKDDQANTNTNTNNTAVQPASPDPIYLKPYDNILHEYSSYTYKFTLSVMSKDDYNSLINDPNRTVNLKNILIASGGAAQDKRQPYFKEDFYFESIIMDTTFGINAAARNTNVAQTKIKIIEPYGVTLIERLVTTTTDLVKSDNYAEQPYMLTLDFWGYDDEALAPKKIEGCTRHFMVTIVDITFEITGKGAAYELTFSPYAHSAYLNSVMSLSSNIEVSAKTVKEFFGNAADSAQAATKAGTKGTSGREDRADVPPGPDTLVGSLGYALTQDSRIKKEKGQIEIADEYVFVIDKEIADATILAPTDKSIKDVPMKTELYQQFAAKASNKNITYDNDKRKISVAAGTTIIEIINDVVLHSTYMLNQIIDSNDSEAESLKQSKAISWVIIIPDVELLGYDQKRNTFAKRFTFTVTKLLIFGHNHEQMGQAPVPGAAKIYDYIYTGQNKDIIDLKIEFKNVVTYINANRKIKSGTAVSESIDKNPNKTDVSTPPADAFPSKQAVSNRPALNSASRASTNSNDLILNDVRDSLTTGYQRDMVSVDMDVVGDPAYITQTDIFYGKYTTKFANMPVLPDRSLNPCTTEIYVLLRFNTPTDIDLEKGIYDFGSSEGDQTTISSSFTGLYRVYRIISNFSNGKFTQTLTLTRMQQQSTNYIIQSAAKDKFTKQDVSAEKIKKLETSMANTGSDTILGGIGKELLDLVTSFKPIKNLLNGRL